MDLDYIPHTSPINPGLYSQLTVLLMSIGTFFMAWFFVYEVTSTKFSRQLTMELMLSLTAATFLGFGTLFTLLWSGIYV